MCTKSAYVINCRPINRYVMAICAASQVLLGIGGQEVGAQRVLGSILVGNSFFEVSISNEMRISKKVVRVYLIPLITHLTLFLIGSFHDMFTCLTNYDYDKALKTLHQKLKYKTFFLQPFSLVQ